MLKDIFLFGGLISYDHTFIYLFYFFLVVAIIVAVALCSTRSLQLVPHGMQNIAEAYLSGVLTIGKDAMGSEEQAKKYLPLIATLGFVIFFSNVIGLVPGFESPSASLNLTLSLTLCVWLYYHFEGVREHGVINYLKHFMGPVKILAPFMFVLAFFARRIAFFPTFRKHQRRRYFPARYAYSRSCASADGAVCAAYFYGDFADFHFHGFKLRLSSGRRDRR